MHLTFIQKIVIWALPVLFAITIHEVAHGWVASKLGDKTALMLGRLTLNPFKHIDLIGTILVPLILLTFSNFIFGWAKPVPINPRNFQHRRRDMLLVAIAGPFTNLLMAFIWGGIMKLGLIMMGVNNSWALPIVLMGQAGILINVVLMVFNLIPIPPLDGSHFISALIPGRWAYHYDKVGRFGFFIVLLLIVTGVLIYILGPPIFYLNHLISVVFHLPMM